MIFKLFLNDLNKNYQIFTFMKRMKRRRQTVIAEGATRYSEKRSNMLTWFQYGRLARKIYLWCLDNKELLGEIFHSIIDFVFE